MDILKTAIEWTKDEIFSSVAFILIGSLFVAVSIGFWQLGKTEVARAFIIPNLVAGILVLALGIGLLYTNNARLAKIESEYNSDAAAFVKAEITRTEKTIGEYKTFVFRAFPVIIILASLLIMLVDTPIWRAIGITTIAMIAFVTIVDSNADARIKAYHENLVTAIK